MDITAATNKPSTQTQDPAAIRPKIDEKVVPAFFPKRFEFERCQIGVTPVKRE